MPIPTPVPAVRHLRHVPPDLRPLSRRGFYPTALICTFLLAALVPLSEPLRSRQSWLVFQVDDFYYYLAVARNLAHGYGSTANGLVSTNGYHPLWLLLLTAACRISTAATWLATVLFFTSVVATVATLLLSLRWLPRAAHLSPLAALPLALVATLYCLKLFFTGMEVTLTIPLALASLTLFDSKHLWQDRFTLPLLLGLLLSATMLSRLDSTLLILLLTAGTLAEPTLRRQLTPSRLAALALGLLPVAVYFALNHHLFGTFLPISGAAKQLRHSHLPSPAVWQSIAAPHPLSALKLAIPGAGLILLLREVRSLRPSTRIALAAATVFPLLHFAVLSILSDWGLWPWYFYSLRISLVATLILVARLPILHRLLARRPFAIAFSLLAAVAALTTRRDITQTSAILGIARQLATFSQTHPPAIYAMGDRAGLVAYLLPQPLVQTEGLTMDAAFLGHLRRGDPLLPTLRHLGVRYYIANVYNPLTPIPPATCFHAVEPLQAGPTAPHMTATLCAPPAARFDSAGFPTLVFDLTREPATP